MKKVITSVTVLLMLLSLAACTPSQPQQSVEPTQDATSSAGEPQATKQPDPTEYEPTVQQDDPEAWVYENDKYAYDGYNTLNLVAIDELGRYFVSASGEKEDKEVGLFFDAAEGFHAAPEIYDIEKLIAEFGFDKVFYHDFPESPNNTTHYCFEPLWGYYKSEDPYVVKKQLQMLTAAGVDYLVVDATNGWFYQGAVTKIAKYIQDLQAEGWNPPKLVYYVHSMNNKTVREIYNHFYKTDKFDSVWYKKNGKPCIIAYTDTARDLSEAATRGVTNFNDPIYDDLSQEILDFFHFIEPRWPNDIYLSPTDVNFDKGKKTGFCWIEWTHPIPVRETSLGSFMNVSVASHPSIPFSFSLTRNARNWGRGWSFEDGQNNTERVHEDIFFEESWAQAIEKAPDTVLVVGWNMWNALKQEWAGEYMMCDTCNWEYSLSIEPAKGYYNDSVYLQMIRNMRKYKYTEGENVSYDKHLIDVNGSITQWYNVGAVYRQIGEETFSRNANSADIAATYKYKVSKPANSIAEARVAHTDSKLYFMIRCTDDITERGDAENWMNLFIGNGTELDGFSGFTYVLNRSTGNGTTDVIKLNADFTGEKVGEAKMTVTGSVMMIEVDRALVGLGANDNFYFKVADSVEKPDDIMDYYVSGSVMPIGRLAYEYRGK